MAMKKRDQVIQILHEVTGKDANPDYAPYNPICEKCGRFTKPIFDNYEFPYVWYECVRVQLRTLRQGRHPQSRG